MSFPPFQIFQFVSPWFIEPHCRLKFAVFLADAKLRKMLTLSLLFVCFFPFYNTLTIYRGIIQNDPFQIVSFSCFEPCFTPGNVSEKPIKWCYGLFLFAFPHTDYKVYHKYIEKIDLISKIMTQPQHLSVDKASFKIWLERTLFDCSS